MARQSAREAAPKRSWFGRTGVPAPSETEGSTDIGRSALGLDDREISYLHAGEGPPVLLLHGTFWSRVWRPVMDGIAKENEVFAPDYPGFGRSGGRLLPEEAAVPELA
jgi:hypothetical protein